MLIGGSRPSLDPSSKHSRRSGPYLPLHYPRSEPRLHCLHGSGQAVTPSQARTVDSGSEGSTWTRSCRRGQGMELTGWRSLPLPASPAVTSSQPGGSSPRQHHHPKRNEPFYRYLRILPIFNNQRINFLSERKTFTNSDRVLLFR